MRLIGVTKEVEMNLSELRWESITKSSEMPT